MDKWEGKVAVVTGASAGIGKSIVERLVQANVKTVGLARRIDRLCDIRESLGSKKENFFPRQCDITDETHLRNTLISIHEEIGPISILINNAGIMSLGKVCEQSSDIVRRTFETNVIAVCNATRETVNLMRKSKTEGHIVIISSTLGHYLPTLSEPKLGCYVGTKHAITGLMKELRQELSFYKCGIKISCVSPGLTRSEIFHDDADDLYNELKACLEPEDVADAVLYCLSTSKTAQVHDIILKPTDDTI